MQCGSNRHNCIIQNWMLSRSTINFIGLWEQLNNHNFKGIEFDAFKNGAGSNTFSLTPKKESTTTVLVISKSGRHGSTQELVFELVTS